MLYRPQCAATHLCHDLCSQDSHQSVFPMHQSVGIVRLWDLVILWDDTVVGNNQITFCSCSNLYWDYVPLANLFPGVSCVSQYL